MSDAPSRERFEVSVRILPGDVDALGHVNNVVYLRWVQEAAVAHWNAAATEAQKAEVLWVVARHEIDYRRPAMPEDAVVARTWVGAASRNSFERHTEILRASDQVVLARARTVWVPIDPATGQVKRSVSAGLRERFSVPAPE